MSSDSASSEVTYMSISSHGDPLAWAADFFGLQEPDSPEATPASPEYVYGPEELEQAPPSPDYVPGYVADLDPEEDSEDSSVDYPADGGDDDDDDDSSDDDNEEEEEASKEEKEHLALANSVVAHIVDHVPSSEETELFETDESAATPPPPAYRATARMSIRAHAPIQFPFEAEIPSPPLPSLPLPSPPLPPLPSSLYLPPPVPTSLLLPSPPLPPLPASLFIPPPVDRREDTPKAELPTYKRLCLTAPTSRFEIRRQRAEEVGYGIKDVWVDLAEAVEKVALTTLEGVNDRVTELAEKVSPGDSVVDGARGFSVSRGLCTVSGIEFSSSPGAVGI
ncbi:hypothetical protein Tco_1331073 [Tanacetum coccineum]